MYRDYYYDCFVTFTGTIWLNFAYIIFIFLFLKLNVTLWRKHKEVKYNNNLKPNKAYMLSQNGKN